MRKGNQIIFTIKIKALKRVVLQVKFFDVEQTTLAKYVLLFVTRNVICFGFYFCLHEHDIVSLRRRYLLRLLKSNKL